MLMLWLLILPQRLQTHHVEYATPHIALLLLRDRRRTLSSGLLAREGWHGREEELLRGAGRGAGLEGNRSGRLSERGADPRLGMAVGSTTGAVRVRGQVVQQLRFS